MRNNIYRQAALAGLTIVLTVVILFAMTSAWYTNIVQTSGLVFEAESWGFDGNITIGDEIIQAAPGDDGLIPLKVENTGEGVSAITVNVSKGGMTEEMQKRLYFYVDTNMSRNSEIMDRVYINSREGYTYTLFQDGSLTLSEQVSNAPQLRWHWVYDVLGYYVLAQATTVETTQNGKATSETKMTVYEYLRPIEYDYDAATVTITESGNTVTAKLSTVDGTMEPGVYLWALSKKDGYQGVIDPQKKLSNGYYPVDVDDTGYGVYAYLCDYSEIQTNTLYDTKLGELAYKVKNNETLTTDEEKLKEALSNTVTLNISAQKTETTAVNVSTFSSLQQAINMQKADVVQLSSDITLNSDNKLIVANNARVMLDLNGHTIKNTSGVAIEVQSGSSLTLTNGKLEAMEKTVQETTHGIYATGAEVVMSKVDITGFDYGVNIRDDVNDNELDSLVRLVGCTIDGKTRAVMVSGNGTRSDQKTQVIIESCTLSSEGVALSGNGDTSRSGTDIQIIDSTVKGITKDGVPAGAIFQPQKDSTMRIYNSTVIGYNGVAIKGGTVEIVKSTIKGDGDVANAAAFSSSGYTDTADAVYIETNYGYEIVLNISDSELYSVNGQCLQVYEKSATNVAVHIESGTFNDTSVQEYLPEGKTLSGPESGKYQVINAS